MKYGKLKNNIIMYAPKNKGGISNYYIDEKNLKKDGYLPIVEEKEPQDDNEYLQVNKIIDDKIVMTWEKRELSYQELRERDYPNVGDMIDAICKKLDGNSLEYDNLQIVRNEIKTKYPKPQDSAVSEGTITEELIKND